jgi:HEAT repeat protein
MGRVDRLIRQLETGESPYERVKAAEALGELGKRASPKVLDAFYNALNDSEAWVRHAVVVALGKIGTEDAIELLIYAMENDEEAEIRFTAAEILHELGAESAWSAFKNILDVEPSAEIREIAVRALGKVGYGEPTVVDKLIAVLESYLDQPEKVRVAAAESLGKLDDAYALPPLFRAGENDRSDAVRNAARQAYHALFLRSVEDFLRLPEQERHELGRELQEALREHFVKTLCENNKET